MRFSVRRPGAQGLACELPIARVPIGIVTLKNRTLSPVAKLFIDTCSRSRETPNEDEVIATRCQVLADMGTCKQPGCPLWVRSRHGAARHSCPLWATSGHSEGRRSDVQEALLNEMHDNTAPLLQSQDSAILLGEIEFNGTVGRKLVHDEFGAF